MIRLFLLFKSMLAGLLVCMASASTAHAQEDRLLQLARDSAIVAGGGRYCKFDPDEVEEFIAKAEARLSVLARDDYEKVLARLEFKNILDAYSVRAPSSSCAEFRAIFDQARRNIR